MPNYSLNVDVPQEDRTLEDMGFNGMTYHENHPKNSKPVPYDLPSPLEDHVVESANTIRAPFPDPSGNLARRIV